MVEDSTSLGHQRSPGREAAHSHLYQQRRTARKQKVEAPAIQSSNNKYDDIINRLENQIHPQTAESNSRKLSTEADIEAV